MLFVVIAHFVTITSSLCVSVLFLLQTTTNLLMLECVHGNRCFIVVVIMMIEDVCKENSLTSQCKVILFDFQSLPQKIHQVFLPCLHFEFSSTSVCHSGSVTRCLFSANSSWWRVGESANFVKNSNGFYHVYYFKICFLTPQWNDDIIILWEIPYKIMRKYHFVGE